MEREKYELIKHAENDLYEFYSVGPHGKIKKIVSFQRLKNFRNNVYNLAFGDWNASTGMLDDNTVSNNQDRMKVLFTIAAALVDFLESRPNAIILIAGSTSSRTRLYQMAISSHWQKTNQYEIYGEHEKVWGPFQKGVNYQRFLVFKKIE